MNFKNTLRKEIENKLNNLNNQKELSELILNKLISTKEWMDSNSIFLYISFKNEVQTINIIKTAKEQGKKVYAPIITKTSMDFFRIDNLELEKLNKNKYGIIEPPLGLKVCYPKCSSIILVPGLGFSKNGDRLGRGGGYYDKYLPKYNNIIKIALAYNVQIIEQIPTDSWDQKIDFVITDSNLYKTGDYNGNN